MNEHEAEAFVRRFQEAWDSRKPAKLAAILHPDATVYQPPVREQFRGHQVGEYFEQVFVGMPDLTLKLLDWAARGDVVMIEWEITATVGDGPLSWRGIDRFHVRDGLADDEFVYFDSLKVWERLDPSMERPSMVALSREG